MHNHMMPKPIVTNLMCHWFDNEVNRTVEEMQVFQFKVLKQGGVWETIFGMPLSDIPLS